MAIAFGAAIGNASAGPASGTTVAITTTGAVPAGGRVILEVGWANAVTPTGSGGGLSWAVDHTVANSNLRVAILSADAPAGVAASTVLTVTFSGSAFARTATACYFTGIAAASYADGTAGGTGTSNPWTTSAGITTTNADDVIVAVAWIDFRNTTSTATGSFLEALEYYDAIENGTYTVAYRIVSSTGTYTPTGTWASDGQPWQVAAVAYKAAAAAAAAPTLYVIRSGIRLN